MKKMHPGALWLFRLQILFPLLLPVLFISLFMFGAFFSSAAFKLMFLGPIALLALLTEVYARMSYNRWLYELKPDSIRIEKGIIWKKYVSIPYARVQNIDIRRGIVARIFGFSSLFIETAGRSAIAYRGYGGRGGNAYQSEGYLPALGIKDAEGLRDRIMAKIKNAPKSRQGL
jgi:membrane protein YdbS with pleckstrin-like domain